MEETVFYDEQEIKSIRLIIFTANTRLQEVVIRSSTTTIGRTGSGGADVIINSSIVSRIHGSFVNRGGRFYYQDLNSSNGTYVNGVKIGRKSPVGQTEVELKHGDVLRIDHENLKNSHPESVLLIVLDHNGRNITSQSVEIKDDENIVVGRSVGSINMTNTAVSNKHATFGYSQGQWKIVDHNSTNGVFVNGRRINGTAELYSMDVVRIVEYIFVVYGKKVFYFCDEKGKESLVIHIEERNVFQMFKKHTLLKDIDLSISERSMVMILGGSGAGKTTFVNAVMGYEKAKGEIRHENIDIYKDYEKVKNRIGFVPQQDLLRGDDVVYNTLENAVQLKLGHSLSQSDKEKRIAKVLESLGLTRERDSRVKKLSGGQRKRLSIAVELISDPSLFFLDEPDSGLDGIMARSLMEQLRNIADEGKIVMVITHAPDRVRDLFDRVIVLAKSEKENIGRLAFYGSVNEAFEFFGVDSLEGVVKRINRKDEGGDGMSDYYIKKYEEKKQR